MLNSASFSNARSDVIFLCNWEFFLQHLVKELENEYSNLFNVFMVLKHPQLKTITAEYLLISFHITEIKHTRIKSC